jgi:hypothetical protein|tara:strand:+ start:2804 stop:3130 length:327 start_codon:yes stop_codon:yes gene_type:complete
MTDPRYVRSLSDIYTKMYNHPGEEKPLIVEDVEDVPKWKRLLRNGLKEENRKKPPYAADVNDQEDASEEEEENSKASLAIKLVLELLGEEEHDEAAANAIYMIRDLVK